MRSKSAEPLISFKTASVAGLAALVLSGCRFEMQVGEGGRVTSSSGDYDCPAQTVCVGDIGDEGFNQTFTAVPAPGYEFSYWAAGPNNFCGGESDPCTVTSEALPPQLRNGILSSSKTGYLIPVFTFNGEIQTYAVSGQIQILPESILDSDTNNPENGYAGNDSPFSPQFGSNPVTMGGYVALSGTGADGLVTDSGDEDDYVQVSASAGQSVSLIVADFETADLDLYLFDTNGEIVDFSADVGELEELTIPSSGEWVLNAYAYDGASNYVLTLGENTSISRREVVPNELIVEYAGEGVLKLRESEDLRRQATHKLGLTETAGDLGRERLVRRLNPDDLSWLTPQLVEIRDKLAHDPALLARWETQMAAKALAKTKGVARATPNYRVKPAATPNDPQYSFQWHYPLIQLPTAWDLTTGDPSVITAVIDTGIIPNHPEFQGQLTGGYDFISDPSNSGDGNGLDADPTDEGQLIDPDTGEPSNNPGAGSFHGTHVAGTIAAKANNNIGVAGVAYSAKLMPLRALSDEGGTTYDIIQAMRYAAGLPNDSGIVPAQTADVINLSLGGGSYISSEQDVINQIASRGTIIVAASGNAGASSVDYPAAYQNVIAVGATDVQGNVTSYSNRGSKLDVTAPGGDGSRDRNGDGYPDGVFSTLLVDGTYGYGFMSGTSMATPHAAGVIALMRSVNPDLIQSDIEALLISGAITDDKGTTGWDSTYGYGQINAYKAVVAALDSIGKTIELPAQLSTSNTSLNFGASVEDIQITLSNVGNGDLQITNVTSDASWLSATESQTDGAGLGVWNINVDRGLVTQGTYRGTITFASTANAVELSVLMRLDDGTGGNVGRIYILLYDPITDTVADQAVADVDTGYRYRFSAAPAGQYELWAGTDNDNDYFICDEGETCGSWRTISDPVTITIGQDLSNIDFSSDFNINLGTVTSAQSDSEIKAPIRIGLKRQ